MYDVATFVEMYSTAQYTQSWNIRAPMCTGSTTPFFAVFVKMVVLKQCLHCTKLDLMTRMPSQRAMNTTTYRTHLVSKCCNSIPEWWRRLQKNLLAGASKPHA